MLGFGKGSVLGEVGVPSDSCPSDIRTPVHCHYIWLDTSDSVLTTPRHHIMAADALRDSCGRLLLNLLASLAEFELEMIRE